MRKSIAWGVACIMVAVGLVACGGGGGSSSSPATNADVTGTWLNSSAMKSFALTQSGTSVSGTFNNTDPAPAQGDFTSHNVSGTVSGNNLSSTITGTGSFASYSATFTGTVSGTSLSGTYSDNAGHSSSLTFLKQ